LVDLVDFINDGASGGNCAKAVIATNECRSAASYRGGAIAAGFVHLIDLVDLIYLVNLVDLIYGSSRGLVDLINLVYLIDLIYLVYLVDLIDLIDLINFVHLVHFICHFGGDAAAVITAEVAMTEAARSVA